MPNGFEYFAKILLFACSIAGMLYSIFCMYLSRRAGSWPTVVGLIESCGIVETKDSEGDIYKAKVTYVYEYDGKQYSGKRLGFGLHSIELKFIVASAYTKAARHYPKAFVRVNPANPGSSTLLSGIHFYHIFDLFVFVFLFGVACYLLINQSA